MSATRASIVPRVGCRLSPAGSPTEVGAAESSLVFNPVADTPLPRRKDGRGMWRAWGDPFTGKFSFSLLGYLYYINYICIVHFCIIHIYMKSRKLFTRKKAKNGEGRQSVIKHLLLPEEVIRELRLYKDAYSICLSRKKDERVNITWEQMLRRWMDNVGRFDKDVKEYVESGKAHLAANPPAPTFPVDPTEGEIWEMRHYFERNGEELDAIPGDWTPFYAVKEGRNVGMKQLFAEGWMLLNEVGIEINYEQAVKISQILKQQKKKEA